MQLNGHDLVDRYNRPSVNTRVAIRTFFINDGQYVDPYDVSACTIFNKLSNASPDSIVDPVNGLIKSDQDIDTILMNFEISGGVGATTAGVHDGADGRVTFNNLGNTTWFPAYEPQNSASGIHRVGTGDYVTVLDGVLGGDLSGGYNIHSVYNGGTTVQNKTSAVSEYIDVWTVKMLEGSEYQIFITDFRLYNNTFINVAEPLVLTTNNRLVNKHLQLGSTTDLKITTDFTVQNKNIDQATLNLFKDYSINNVAIKIQKVNEDTTNLPGRTTVTPPAGLILWTEDVRVTSDNTILFSLDTNTLSTPLGLANVGGPVGTYAVTARYTVLNQTIVTPPFYFEVS